MARGRDAWRPSPGQEEPPPVPPGVDPEVPSPARLYDYYLGGTINYPADQEAAERIRRDLPEISDMAWANRGFHQRAAKWLAAERGISQFIDIGSGLPTQGNTHQVVREAAADARVVYVDNDPMVRAYAGQLLTDSRLTTFVFADLREPDRVLGNRQLQGLIDFTEPVGLLMTAVLHFVADSADPWGLVARYTRGPGTRQLPRAVPRDRGQCAPAGGADRAVGVRAGHPEHLPAPPGRGGTLLRPGWNSSRPGRERRRGWLHGGVGGRRSRARGQRWLALGIRRRRPAALT